MPEKKSRRKAGEQKEIRSMKDAVDELLAFELSEDEDDADGEAPRREIRSMSEAVSEVRSFAAGEDDRHGESGERVYSDEGAHRTDGAAKSPGSNGKRHSKKRSFLYRFIKGKKKVRRSDAQPLTIKGFRITFWRIFPLLLALVIVLVFFLNSANLSVDEQPVTLMALSPDAEGYRILVLSDLNGKRFGDAQATLLREINSLSYDIVVCLGDMVGKDGDPEPFYELLEGLPASKKVYFICGDSDPGPYTSAVRGENAPLEELVLEDWILGAIERGAIYVDSPERIELDSVSIWLTPASMLNINASDSATLWKEQTAQEESGYLAGIEADTHSLPFTSYRYQLALEHFEAVGKMSESDIHISLSHVPPSDSFIESACNQSALDGKYLTSPDLILAGHYCGGVYNLPLIGAIYVPDSTLERYGWFPESERVSGLREVDNSQIYVTRGLSTCGDTWIMPFRLLNSPEISVITITATSPQSMLE